jgi:hypothetical protein
MKTNDKLHLIRYTTPTGEAGSRLTRVYHETVRDLIERGCKNITCDTLAVTRERGIY